VSGSDPHFREYSLELAPPLVRVRAKIPSPCSVPEISFTSISRTIHWLWRTTPIGLAALM